MSIPVVTLRPFTHADIDVFALAVNQSLESLQPWMVWAHEGYSTEEAASWVTFTQHQRDKRAADEFAIVDGHNRLLGGAGIRYAQQPGECSSLGYWVRRDAQQQGVAIRAVAQLIEFGFKQPQVEALEILAAAENHASRAVALRSGFEFIDYRDGLIVLNSGPVNTAIYHLKRP